MTSGQKNTCMEGTKLLAALQQESQGEICIQAGGGVTPEGIESLYRQTGICAYHMSAKEKLEKRHDIPKTGMSIWGLRS